MSFPLFLRKYKCLPLFTTRGIDRAVNISLDITTKNLVQKGYIPAPNLYFYLLLISLFLNSLIHQKQANWVVAAS